MLGYLIIIKSTNWPIQTYFLRTDGAVPISPELEQALNEQLSGHPFWLKRCCSDEEEDEKEEYHAKYNVPYNRMHLVAQRNLVKFRYREKLIDRYTIEKIFYFNEGTETSLYLQPED